MLPKPSLYLTPIRRSTARLSLPGLAGLAALLLTSCAGQDQYAPQAGRTRVHPRVARAQARPIQGIDVSKFQGKIDWASVRSGGTDFAFIKATEGGTLVDERFAENWTGAKQAGVSRGAYHFMFWCRPADEQAAWFKRTVPNDPDALPPVLDLEWNAQSRTCPRRLPREEALGMIRVMLREMEAHTGKRPIIYTDITFHRDVLEGELSHYPHWVRSTAAEPQERYANRPWLMWQYTAAGRVPGIQTEVDLNAFYGGSADWAKFVATSCDPRLAAQGACNGQTASPVAQEAPEGRPKAAFDRSRASPNERAHLENADQG
jgi:lysozyme